MHFTLTWCFPRISSMCCPFAPKKAPRTYFDRGSETVVIDASVSRSWLSADFTSPSFPRIVHCSSDLLMVMCVCVLR